MMRDESLATAGITELHTLPTDILKYQILPNLTPLEIAQLYIAYRCKKDGLFESFLRPYFEKAQDQMSDRDMVHLYLTNLCKNGHENIEIEKELRTLFFGALNRCTPSEIRLIKAAYFDNANSREIYLTLKQLAIESSDPRFLISYALFAKDIRFFNVEAINAAINWLKDRPGYFRFQDNLKGILTALVSQKDYDAGLPSHVYMDNVISISNPLGASHQRVPALIYFELNQSERYFNIAMSNAALSRLPVNHLILSSTDVIDLVKHNILDLSSIVIEFTDSMGKSLDYFAALQTRYSYDAVTIIRRALVAAVLKQLHERALAGEPIEDLRSLYHIAKDSRCFSPRSQDHYLYELSLFHTRTRPSASQKSLEAGFSKIEEYVTERRPKDFLHNII